MKGDNKKMNEVLIDKVAGKEFFEKVKDKLARAGLVAVFILVAASQKADAVSPLTDVPSSSTPIAAIAAPNTTSYGNLTGGAGGIVDSEGNVTNEWIATTDYGYIHKYQGQTLVDSIFTGISGLSGAVYLGDNKFALSAQGDIYKGTLTSSWSTDDILGVNGISSDLTDVSFYNGKFYAPTKSNGIVRIDPATGDSDNIGSGAFEAYDVLAFVPGVYDNDMAQIRGQLYANIDNLGNLFGSSEECELSNYFEIQGMSYFGDGNSGFTNMAVIQAPGIQFHDNSALAYMDNMQAIHPKTLQADINNSGFGDGIVDIQDLTILIDEWLTPGVYANFDGEDMVDLKDFSVMADEWLLTESWYGN